MCEKMVISIHFPVFLVITTKLLAERRPARLEQSVSDQCVFYYQIKTHKYTDNDPSDLNRFPFGLRHTCVLEGREEEGVCGSGTI